MRSVRLTDAVGASRPFLDSLGILRHDHRQSGEAGGAKGKYAAMRYSSRVA